MPDRFADAVKQAIEALERENRAGRVKRPWVLDFTSEDAGIFLKPCDVEATPVADPILAIETKAGAEERRALLLAAWDKLPPHPDIESGDIGAYYSDSIGCGSHEDSEDGWQWQTWAEIP